MIESEVLRQLLLGLAMVLIMLTRPAGIWPRPRHEDRMSAPRKDIGAVVREEKRLAA